MNNKQFIRVLKEIEQRITNDRWVLSYIQDKIKAIEKEEMEK